MAPDEIDTAQEQDYLATQDALRKRRPAGPPPTGRCHYCDELLPETARWCGVDCREAWERERILRRNAGG